VMTTNVLVTGGIRGNWELPSLNLECFSLVQVILSSLKRELCFQAMFFTSVYWSLFFVVAADSSSMYDVRIRILKSS